MQLTQSDYFEWFSMSEELGVDAIRVYTLLPPTFYKALYDWNNGKKKPLLLFHGIWSPEEELVGPDQKGRDAWNEEYLEIFIHNCENVVGALHGDITIEQQNGQAYGEYTYDVAGKLNRFIAFIQSLHGWVHYWYRVVAAFS